MARVVLDTDVASLSYKGRVPASLATRLVEQEVCVTFVTIGELSRWAEKRRWGTRARTELVAWLGRAVVLPYDERVAWDGGSAQRPRRRGGAVPVRSMTPGSRRAVWSLHSPLATLNLKDLEDFVEHGGLRLIGLPRASTEPPASTNTARPSPIPDRRRILRRLGSVKGRRRRPDGFRAVQTMTGPGDGEPEPQAARVIAIFARCSGCPPPWACSGPVDVPCGHRARCGGQR